jgi:hypothetical protein
MGKPGFVKERPLSRLLSGIYAFIPYQAVMENIIMIQIKGLGARFDIHRFGEKSIYIFGAVYGFKGLRSAPVGIIVFTEIYRSGYGAGKKQKIYSEPHQPREGLLREPVIPSVRSWHSCGSWLLFRPVQRPR